EYRVRDAADRAHRARHGAAGGDAGLRTRRGDGRDDAPLGSEQGHPQAVGAHAAGSTKRIVVPRPGSLSAEIVPPWAWTRLFAIASPSPEPRDSGERAKRSNTCASSSGAMPSPVSVTRNATPPSSRSAAIVTLPPDGVWRSAFETRFASTSPIRTRSTSSSGRFGGCSGGGATPRAGGP